VWDVVIFRIPLQMSENRTAKIDGPMTFGYGIDATDSACKNQRCGTNICFSRQRAGRHNDDRPLVTLGLEKSREREAQYHKVFSNHAIVAVVTAPTAELVEQAADRLTARLTARHGTVSVWFGIGKASGCGSIGWKRLAHRHACRGHASALATSGSVACGMPRWGTSTDQSRSRATFTKASSAGE
jgi:hypothetical protein